jgi:proteasome accessory factor A
VGLETTLKRPIINTRDEPHADADKYRRLHVIIGDANLAELSTYLKVGTTSLVLAMIEARALPRDLTIEEPVEALQAISHDPSLTHKVRLRDGRQLTALEVQQVVPGAGGEVRRDAGRVRRADRRRAAPVGRGARRPRDRPDALRDRLDWPPKLRLLEGYRSRTGSAGATRGCTWSTCSTPTSGPTRGSTTGWWPAGRCSGCSPTTR